MLHIALALLCRLVPLTSNITTSVDPAVQYQTWEGFGTSLCWWANIVGDYPEPLRSNLVKKAIGDLGLTVLRYNIGGGEAPGLNYMELRARVPGYLSADGTYDWTADAAQRWVLQRGRELGANKFEAFSNSPPYFMTVSGSVTGAQDGGDNLAPAHLNDFANYLVTVTKHFHDKWNVNFETLESMNEPCAPWWTYGNRQEGCHVSPGSNQSALVVATGTALASAKLKTRVSACDESYNSWAVSSWDALTTDAKPYIMRLNTHCYSGSSQHWVNNCAVRDTKRVWMSEYGDGDASGMQMAHQIVNDLRQMMPTAWVYWQSIDAGGGWGCIDMDLNNRAQTFTVNRKYYAMSQFSRFIRPGAKFISVGDPNSICALHGNQLIIATVSDSAQTATYDLSRFSTVGARVAVTQTSPAANFALQPPIAIAHKAFTVNLPASSVTTFVINGCTYQGAVFDGFQTLSSNRTGALLDVPGDSTTEGQFLSTDPGTGDYGQQWRVEGYGDGTVKLCNRSTGMYAAIWDSQTANYPVLQWEDDGDTTMPWSLFRLAANVYSLNPFRYPSWCMTENPTRGNGWPDVAIYPSYGGKEQKWRVIKAAPLYPDEGPQ